MLTCLEMKALEVLQRQHRPRQNRARPSAVELHHLVAGTVPAVAQGEADRDCIATPADKLQIAVGKPGVAQAMPKGEERLPGKVVIIVQPPGGLVVIDQGQLSRAEGKGDRQPAGGIVLPEKHLSDGMAAFLAGIPEGEDGPGLVDPGVHRHRAAAGEQHRHRRAGGGHRPNQLLLCARQVQAGAVMALPLHDAGADQRHIARAGDAHRFGQLFRVAVRKAIVPNQPDPPAASALAEFDAKGVAEIAAELQGNQEAVPGALLPVVDDQ